MPLADASRIPSSTYRVQLHHAFTFHDLLQHITYLRRLGISDLYLSPIFTASPGSLHGYDVNDYLTINPELGGEEGFSALSDRLYSEDMGILLDIVPNHMGITGPLNGWWRDVLENGEASAYAPFFDIQWNSPPDKGRHRVLVPMLAEQYGTELEAGKIRLVYDGAFYLTYWENRLPVTPASYGTILGPLIENPSVKSEDRAEVNGLWQEYLTLPPAAPADSRSAHSRRDKIIRLKSRLALWIDSQPDLKRQLEERLAMINGHPGEAATFNELDRIIEEQHYRIALWKTGAHEINYRRFFAIDSLVGVHEEDPAVFQECHRLVRRLVREGRVTGLRVDHIDGLRQPEQYLQRLQTFERPESKRPLYTVVEKILARDEDLPATWAVHGTTGYEFIPQLAALLVDHRAESQLNETYARFTSESTSYADAVYAKKRMILDELFANAVNNLGTDLADIITEDRKWQDLTRSELVVAVRELMANLSVYRTYRIDVAPIDPVGRRVMEQSCVAAITRNPSLDSAAFTFVRDVVTGDYPEPEATALFRRRIVDWVLTFQQYTGAVMAKSVEDTTFYTYCRFIGLNEVGGDPELFAGSLTTFHAANEKRLREAPHSQLTDSTHDTKFSEDVRARLYALSEVPEAWDKAVSRWHELNAPHRACVDGSPVPDSLDEYRLYQTLIGAWPLDPLEVDDSFRNRLKGHLRKAVDEAKRHTSILKHNESYHAGCQTFLEAILDPKRSPEFLAEFAVFARRIAHVGLGNAMAQLILKCTVPGVPDLYQGNDIWEFSLVDPDNRRPVDYPRRLALLDRVEQMAPAELLEHWKDGGIKLRLTQVLLTFRQAHPTLFSRGSYQPLSATGSYADHVVAFLREIDGTRIVVVVPRLCAAIGTPALGVAWDDTALTLPGQGGQWRELTTGEMFFGPEPLKLQHLFAGLPFAVLVSLP